MELRERFEWQGRQIAWDSRGSGFPPNERPPAPAHLGGTLGLVPGAGHLIHYDAPAALMDHVRSWLDRHVAC